MHDPKFQGELIQAQIKSGESLAFSALVAELTVLCALEVPVSLHRLCLGRSQYPKFKCKQLCPRSDSNILYAWAHMNYCGHVKGCFSFLKTLLTGTAETEIRRLTDTLLSLLEFADLHAEKLPDYLLAMVPLFSRMIGYLSPSICGGPKASEQDMFSLYLNLTQNIISSDWHRYVRGQLEKGGGRLFHN